MEGHVLLDSRIDVQCTSRLSCLFLSYVLDITDWYTSSCVQSLFMLDLMFVLERRCVCECTHRTRCFSFRSLPVGALGFEGVLPLASFRRHCDRQRPKRGGTELTGELTSSGQDHKAITSFSSSTGLSQKDKNTSQCR